MLLEKCEPAIGNKLHNGFSLIELIIVLVIIGVLIAVIIPNYTAHLVKVRRTYAKVALIDIASRLEQYYVKNNSYTGATLANLNVDTSRYKDFYQVSLNIDAHDFQLRADPILKQAELDAECAAFLLNQNGKKEITGVGAVSACW